LIRIAKISPRLRAVLSLITGESFADIGTDHGYLPITACVEGVVKSAIACDINAGPLKKAEDNINRYGLADRIAVRLGFGFVPIQPKEVQTAVMAGMGGMKAKEILEKSPDVVSGLKRLIIQPQHDIPALRRAIHGAGLNIADEIMLTEDMRYYTVIAAEPSQIPEKYTENDYLFGKCLIEKKDEALKSFLARELEKYRRIPGRAAYDMCLKIEEVLNIL